MSDETREIRLPGLILDQIKVKEDKGDYKEDESRYTQFETKKRKGKTLTRKEKRQEERKLKKQKKAKPEKSKQAPATVASQPNKHASKKDEQDPLAALKALKEKKNKQDPLAQLAALKEKKNKSDPLAQLAALKAKKNDPLAQLAALKAKKNKKFGESELKIVKEDDLDDEVSDFEDVSDEGEEDDFGGFDESENEIEDFNEEFEDDEGLEDFDEADFDELSDNLEDDFEEDPLAKLKALKEAKKRATDDPLAQLKALKEAKKTKESEDKKSRKSEKDSRMVSTHDLEMMKRDEDDMSFYAKKLGLKSGKKGKLAKTDDDDLIGGLLDDLELDFGYGSDKSEQFEHSSEEENESNYSEDDFEENTPKENPYVAPTVNQEPESPMNSENSGRYIPPALRRKLALEANGVSEEVLNLRKAIKGPLNKLSEANIATIVNDISGLFLLHARHTVNEELTNIILDSIIQQGRLLDTFVYLHATLVAALYRLQGVEFGAHFIQALVEKFESFLHQSGKESSNLVSLLSSVYLFSLVSSKLLYDIIKVLINDLNEINAELLLRLIRNSGNQMRSDDPSALKEIVLLINKKVSSLPRADINTRTQFLIETITSLKNNKMKINNEGNHQLTIRLKKFLGGVNNNKINDPIQVTLDDIHNIETRGKWWLVGSAWKGHERAENDPVVNELAVNVVLDNAEPNWMELARAQRMNTDIRRAIFISIMSATDYIDAVTKLDKLGLKRSQEREIPRVLIHCTGVEPAWNPYYGILGNKLCENHSYRKTFQFMLWDLIKDFENKGDGDSEDEDFLGFDNDIDDETKLKRVLNLGRFYGFLLSEGSLPLHILRTINFLTASSDTTLFMEVVLVTFLDQVAKKSQINSVGAGLSRKAAKMADQKFEDKLLIERILKAQEQPTLLRGVQFFLQDKVRNSGIISGRKQRVRIEWGVGALVEIIDEFLKDKDQL